MAKKDSPVAAAGQVKVRVLSNCTYGNTNDVVALDAAEAEGAQANGLVDATPEAVAYAESLIPAEPV